MHFSSLLNAASLLAATAVAVPVVESPSTAIEKRQEATYCDQYDYITEGVYHLNQFLWGESSATSGSQCTTFISLTGDVIEWSTSYSWAGDGNGVKSYNNVGLVFDPVQLSAVSSIPTSWSWSQTATSVGADISYDMFTSADDSTTGTQAYEVMVWLAALGGVEPLGSSTGTVTVAGSSWDLWSGPNGDTTVYSFVAASTISDFNEDLNAFFTYLIDNEGLSSSQYLISISAGTEAFTGVDVVLTSTYSVSISG